MSRYCSDVQRGAFSGKYVHQNVRFNPMTGTKLILCDECAEKHDQGHTFRVYLTEENR